MDKNIEEKSVDKNHRGKLQSVDRRKLQSVDKNIEENYNQWIRTRIRTSNIEEKSVDKNIEENYNQWIRTSRKTTISG